MATKTAQFETGFRLDGPTNGGTPTGAGVAAFGDPPPAPTPWTHPRASRRRQFIDALKARPGEWAEYLPGPGKRGWSGNSSASQLKHLDPHIEVTCRDTTRKGATRIWARWMP